MKQIILLGLILFALFPSYSLKAQFVEGTPTVIENSVQTDEGIGKWSQTKNFFLDFVVFLIVILLSASFIGLIASAVNFFSAGGDEGTIDNGFKLLWSSIVGIALAVLGYIVISVIKYFF